ncbi:hypothetical protein BDM02DRAFT_3025910 [Thelephora ganbajun]|uniref:Uncharacterized protein n=1 Tax=Thelephora ganbajun TaxID=370292 RepID=A0ACB6Z9Q4_THEGA|nr:hypothetical protein BDM02DRAFT_3025910 [Thelephora ganbajun]
MSARNPRISPVMVPELLESFPAPPSFIPPSPRTPLMPNTPSTPSAFSPNLSNPPPTLPPTSPLPPLPAGPSPISEEETLLFLSSASRLKRLSRLSINSTSSRRDSTATTTSVISNGSANGGVPGLSPSMSGSSISSSSSSTSSSARIRTESLTSSHSLRSYPSTSSLSVVSASASHSFRLPTPAEKSPQGRLIPPMEISITEEDDGISTSADLTAVTLDFLCSDMDEENGLAQFPVPPQPVRKLKTSPPPSSFKSPPPVTASTRSQPFPNKEGGTPGGRTSPDIQTIISETPRPRRRKSSLLSNPSSREQSRSRAPSLKRQPQRSSAPSAILGQTSYSRPAMTRKLSLPDGRHEDTPGLEADEIDMDRLERELEGDGTESDSSLDLHTPFAHVMLRDGLISPRSKVIMALGTSTRPGSTISIELQRLREQRLACLRTSVIPSNAEQGIETVGSCAVVLVSLLDWGGVIVRTRIRHHL